MFNSFYGRIGLLFVRALFFAISSLSFLGAVSALHANKELDSINLLNESKFWPERVTVNVEITGVTYGNTVKSGQEWIFLRYEDGKCLVDMGHNGIHTFAADDTDIAERISNISKKRAFPFRGLFTHRYTKSFYDPKKMRGLQLGDLDQYEFFVLFYFDYESGSNVAKTLAEFIQKYLNELNTEMKLEVLMLPSGNIIADGKLSDYIADGLVARTATPFMLKGMVHTLKHDYKIKGDVVLIDKFGKVIKQFFLSNLTSDGDLIKIFKDTLAETF